VQGLRPAFLIGGLVILTGLPLLLAYDHDPERANASVRAMDASGLAWVRSVHLWGAAALLVVVILHLANHWVHGGPELRSPKAWYHRAALLPIAAAAFLTGGILRWDQHGWESLQHAALGSRRLGVPVEDPSTAPLGLVLVAHAVAIPAALALLAASFHRAGWKLLPLSSQVWREAAWAAAPVLAAVGLLALIRPAPLGPAPIPGAALSKPEWPFLWLDPLQDAFGAAGLILGVAALGIGLAAAPWIGRRWSARARVSLLYGLGAAWLFLTLRGAYA
jgi:quinol-cytochrome oxidoreductase complex cytochrome b subunit